MSNHANLLIQGKNILRSEIRIKKNQVKRPGAIPQKLELDLTDYAGAIHLSAIIGDKYFTIERYYNKNEARQAYKKAMQKFEDGKYEIQLGFEIRGVTFK